MKILTSNFFIKIFIIFFFINQCFPRIVKKTFSLSSLKEEPHTDFISKFDIGFGLGKFTTKYSRIKGFKDFDMMTLRIGILRDSNFQQFKNTKNCQQRQKYYFSTQKLIPFSTSTYGSVLFQINEHSRQQIWYLYIYACEQINNQYVNGTIQFETIMLNNNDHFGEDEQIIKWHIVLFVGWLIFAKIQLKNVIESVREVNTPMVQIILYMGYLVLGLTIFYRLLNLFAVGEYGQDIQLLVILFSGMKYLVQGLMVTTLVAISWGWSLTHLKHKNTQIVAGSITALANLLTVVLDIMSEDSEYGYHPYDNLVGMLSMIIRVAIFIGFVFGILSVKTNSVGIRKHFISKFGLRGGMFLIAWPMSVLFAQLFLPKYLHNQVITLTEEGAHLIAIGYLIQLFANPRSDFQKVSMKTDDQQFPEYLKRSEF